MKYYSKRNNKFIAYWRGTVNGEPKWERRYINSPEDAHQWFNEIVDGGGVLTKTAIIPLDHPFMKLIKLR